MPLDPYRPPQLDPHARLLDRIAELERQMRSLLAFLQGGCVSQIPVVDALPSAGREGRLLGLSTNGKVYYDNGSSWVAQT